jgi:hypothetical protein
MVLFKHNPSKFAGFGHADVNRGCVPFFSPTCSHSGPHDRRVFLSQRSISWLLPWSEKNNIFPLNVLPVNLIISFFNNDHIVLFRQDLNALRDDLMELKPTLLVGVPRVYEKIYEGGKMK